MKSFFLTIAFIASLWGGPFLVFSESIAEESFEINEIRWTIKLHPIDSFDSDFASEGLEISSDPETPAFVQPAWIGDDPGDLGPLWVVQDEDETVLGACWSFYDSGELECIPLDVPPTLYLE